jgi:hypothetical protein
MLSIYSLYPLLYAETIRNSMSQYKLSGVLYKLKESKDLCNAGRMQTVANLLPSGILAFLT